jgi:hypothetical protein
MNNTYKFLFCIVLSAGFCLAADSSGTKFRLSVGAGGAYVFSTEYLNQFDYTYNSGPLSKSSIVPTVNIGFAINPRFSIFLRYSHLMIFSDRSYENFQQLEHIGVVSSVIPSEKFSNLYLDFSLDNVFSWPSTLFGTFGCWYHGGGTTIACGYRINKHFRVQIDMDCLYYSFGLSFSYTFNSNDPGPNPLNYSGPAFGTNWFNISLGLSAFWDIF